jgi:molybdopterin converting factor small subunit
VKIQVRGGLRAALGTGAVEIDVPPEGLALSDVLARVAATGPRAQHALAGVERGQVLRVVHNGTVLDRGGDPWVAQTDSVLLLVAVQGGQ